MATTTTVVTCILNFIFYTLYLILLITRIFLHLIFYNSRDAS